MEDLRGDSLHILLWDAQSLPSRSLQRRPLHLRLFLVSRRLWNRCRRPVAQRLFSLAKTSAFKVQLLP